MNRILPAALLAVASTAIPGTAALAAAPEVITSTYHGTSPAMRDVVADYPPTIQQGGDNYVVPNIFPKTGVPGADEARAGDHGFGMQRAPSGVVAPPIDMSFVGLTLGTGGNAIPPDTNGDASPDHYIQWVNTAWAIFDKDTGARTSGPTAGNSFWSSFPPTSRCRSTNAGDPIALWDDRAQRWLMTQFTTPAAGTNVGSQCVAVSQTDDPLGAYHLYEFTWPAFGDYPHFGVWNDESGSQSAYVLVTHDFNLTPVQQFLGAGFIALDREKMLAGEPATAVRFGGNDAYGAMPAHLDGMRDAPAGACPTIVHFDGASSEYLFWDLCVDWDTPANSTLSPVTRIASATPFVPNFTAVPQLGSATPLDSFGSNVMYKASAWAYEPGSPTTVSLVINHAVRADDVSGAVKWVHFDMKPRGSTLDRLFGYGFDLAPPSRGLLKSIVQEGAFAPDDHTRWMGAIAIDQSLNIGLGHNIGGATISPRLAITGRTFGDPAGQMRGEQECTPGGTGSQTGNFSGRGRWGDYASMSIDPVDQCTFWFTGEYYATTSTSSWSTRVCSFRFPECGLPDFAIVSETPTRIEMCAANPGANAGFGIVAATISGFDDTVSLSAGNLPAGLAATFSRPSGEAPFYSALSFDGLDAVASGEYDIDVIGEAGGNSRSLKLQLGVSADLPAASATVAPADGATGVKVRPTLSWQAVPGALQYEVELAADAGFGNVVASALVSGTSWPSTVTLDTETEYFWRVTARNYCGDGVASGVASFTTGVPGQCPGGTTPTLVFGDDFQSGLNGWSAGGTGGTPWTQQIPNAATGLTTLSWGIPNNTVTSDRTLTSPAIAVPAGAAAVILSYDVWHRFEIDGPNGCWDGTSLEAGNDGSTFSVLTAERMFTDPYTGPISAGAPLAGRDAWCASTPPNAPVRAIVDVDDYAGQDLYLRFRASTDSNTSASAPNGFYLDNLRVEVCQ